MAKAPPIAVTPTILVFHLQLKEVEKWAGLIDYVLVAAVWGCGLCHYEWCCGVICCGFPQDKSWRVRYMVADKFCEVLYVCMYIF